MRAQPPDERARPSVAGVSGHSASPRLPACLPAVTPANPEHVAPRKLVLIHPLRRPLSTCTHSPSRAMTSTRVPLGAEPTTLPLIEGVDLIFTPEPCKYRACRS